MFTDEEKLILEANGMHIHSLNDYWVEHRPDMEVHEYFFKPEGGCYTFMSTLDHVAILTWYALMTKAVKDGHPAKGLRIGLLHVIEFSEVTGHRKEFFDKMLKQKALLGVKTPYVTPAYTLCRLPQASEFLTPSAGPFLVLPLPLDGSYHGVHLAGPQLPHGIECYSPFSLSVGSSIDLSPSNVVHFNY